MSVKVFVHSVFHLLIIIIINIAYLYTFIACVYVQ